MQPMIHTILVANDSFSVVVDGSTTDEMIRQNSANIMETAQAIMDIINEEDGNEPITTGAIVGALLNNLRSQYGLELKVLGAGDILVDFAMPDANVYIDEAEL